MRRADGAEREAPCDSKEAVRAAPLRPYSVTQSGDSNVMVLGRLLSLLVIQVRVLERRDQSPVMPDGAVLVPRFPEADRLERHSRNPDRREEMTSTAPDDGVTSQTGVPPASLYEGADDEHAHDYDEGNNDDRYHALFILDLSVAD
jgi:hypothetical protein